MKPDKTVLLCALCAGIWATGLAAQEHAHGHEHAATHAEAAADGVLHVTDAPLRAGMLKIRDLIRAPRPADDLSPGVKKALPGACFVRMFELGSAPLCSCSSVG